MTIVGPGVVAPINPPVQTAGGVSLRQTAGSPKTTTVTSATNSKQITGLLPANTYKVRVRALDAAGNASAWSDEVQLTTTSSTITTQSFGNVVSGQLTGLTPSTAYTIRIRARDAAGNWSDYSTPSVPLTTAATGPTVVAGLARPVVRSGTVQLDVTATPPGAETITSHSWAIVGGGAGSLTNANTATPTYTAPSSGSAVVTVRDTVTASGGGSATADVLVSYAANIVAAENALTGTARATWDLSSPDLGGHPALQGFCDGFSVNKSDTASFKIAQSDGAGWTAQVYRLGWYNGDGARLYGTLTPSGGQLTTSQSQPAPGDADPVTTKLSADASNWSASLTWSPPAWAPSGIYILRLNRTGGGASHVTFVVRDDARAADLMFMPADSTWNAYNAWGGMGTDQYTGNSLYYGTNVDQYNADCARFVSYDRPVVNRGAADAGRSYGAVEWSTFFTSEYPMLRFVERNGIDTKYYSCLDASGDATGTHLKGGSGRAVVKAAIFVGHNEYWSDAMRAGWESARDAGVSVFSAAGNEVFWRTYGSGTPDAAGRPRIYECYKSTIGARGSTGRTQWTGSWRDPDGAGKGGNSPENSFTGTIFVVNGPNLKSLVVPFAGGYSAQPIWRDTSVAALTTGQSFTSPSQILGFEWDTYGPAGTDGAGASFMASPHVRARFCSDVTYAVSGDLLVDAGDVYGSGNATHRLVVYPGGAGAIVFGTGTVNWSLGCDSANTYQQGADNTSNVIQQATLNMLTDMGAPPTTLMSGLTQPSPVAWFSDVTASLPVTATLTATAARTGPAGSGLAVTATIGAGASRSAPAAASLAVTAALTAAAGATRPTGATLPVTATLSTSTGGDSTATASLAVTAALVTAAGRLAPSAASLAVTATLLTAAARAAPADAALPVVATAIAGAARSASVDAALPVTVTLTSEAVVGAAPVVGTASLALTATLTTAAVRSAPTDASLPVAVTLTATMVLAPARVAGALAVTVTLTAAGTAFGLRTVAGALAVTAALAASLTSNSDVNQFVVADSVTRIRNIVEPGAARATSS